MVSQNEKSSTRLPPGQRETKALLRWGVDHPGITRSIPRRNLSTWKMVVDGLVENPLTLPWNDFLKLPFTEATIDFHCVEGWSVRNCLWGGVQFRILADLAKPKSEGKFVFFESEDGYTTSLTLEELDKAMLAYKLNGKDIDDELGGPMRLIVPDKYAYKSPMWVRRITFRDKKDLGYWERKGYSDTADPWKNDRYR